MCTTPPLGKGGIYCSKLITRHNLIAANMQVMAEGPRHTFKGLNSMSTLGYFMVLSTIIDKLVNCVVVNELVFNTSDQSPVYKEIDIDGIEWGMYQDFSTPKVKWQKLGVDAIYSRYVSVLEDIFLKELGSLKRDGRYILCWSMSYSILLSRF